jgi:hypothetical protein
MLASGSAEVSNFEQTAREYPYIINSGMRTRRTGGFARPG